MPELLKPVFNYQGLPLSFFMRSFVGSAEVSRQCIADLMLRFRTDYIKTTAQKIADPKTRDRVKFMNQTRNNFGMALLSSDEELTQINTPLSGLDSLLSQMYELVTMTTGMPVTKFLGLSPRGFNATGEHDQNNYYDLIAGYENNIARPVLERMGRAVSVLKLTGGYTPKYVFNPLNRLTKTEAATLDNLKADYLKKLDELGVITAEDALRAVKEDDFTFSWVENPPEQDDGGFDFGDMEAAAQSETMDAAWRKEDHPKGKDGQFAKKNGGGEEAEKETKKEDEVKKEPEWEPEREKEEGKPAAQSEPEPIEIKCSEFSGYSSRKELRSMAKEYYKEHFAGKALTRDDLGEINFSMIGFRELVNKSMGNEEVYHLVPYLDEIIRHGVKGERTFNHERTDNFIGFIPITHKVKINGKEKRVKVRIGETADKKYFYCLMLNRSNKDGLTAFMHTPRTGQRQNVSKPSEDSVPEYDCVVNIFLED